jgi:RES domain-containing protein
MACRMAVKPHPDLEQIKRALEGLVKEGRPFASTCYRCTEPQFVDQIVSGFGSQIHGGRWTPKGGFPTVYLCETPEVALQEYLARGRRMKLPDDKSLPMVLAGVKLKIANVLDTTDPKAAAVIRPFLDRERIHWRAIQSRREAVSQAIGRAVKEICFSGLIAASQASPGGRTIIVFPQKSGKSEILTAPAVKPI